MISNEAQLKFCTICIHKKDNDRYGTLCGLTDNYPTFSETCNDFSKISAVANSNSEKQKNFESFSPRESKKKSKTGSFIGKGILIYILLKIAFKVFKHFSE